MLPYEATVNRRLLRPAGIAGALLFQGVLVAGAALGQAVSETNATAFNPREQKPIVLERDDVKVELILSEPFRIRVNNGRAGAEREITLPAELAQVDSLQAVGTTRVGVFGRVNGPFPKSSL